jgi:hypothetical protein
MWIIKNRVFDNLLARVTQWLERRHKDLVQMSRVQNRLCDVGTRLSDETSHVAAGMAR